MEEKWEFHILMIYSHFMSVFSQLYERTAISRKCAVIFLEFEIFQKYVNKNLWNESQKKWTNYVRLPTIFLNDFIIAIRSFYLTFWETAKRLYFIIWLKVGDLRHHLVEGCCHKRLKKMRKEKCYLSRFIYPCYYLWLSSCF